MDTAAVRNYKVDMNVIISSICFCTGESWAFSPISDLVVCSLKLYGFLD